MHNSTLDLPDNVHETVRVLKLEVRVCVPMDVDMLDSSYEQDIRQYVLNSGGGKK